MLIKRSLLAVYSLTLLCFACNTPVEETVAPVSVVQAPIPPLDPNFLETTFNAEEGFNWQIPSGSQITIPPNAFVDQNGKEVLGPIQMRYREMHDALDIYLTGIPMAIGKEHLTTAGSFEVRALQNEEALLLKDSSSLLVKMASFEAGDDFDFYELDEYSGDWANLGTQSPEVNIERKKLVKKIRRMKPGLRFPLNKKYMAFNYQAILDVYFNDNWTKMKADTELPAKLKEYGLGWTEAEVHQHITWKEQKFHAALMVWKNLKKKQFPVWAKERYGRLEKIKGNKYNYHLANKDSSEFFSVELLAVMPLKALFAFPAEHWIKDYQGAMAKVVAEQERLQTMASVYRSFEVAGLGIYNWDKLKNDSESVQLAGQFSIEKELDNPLVDPTIIYFTGDNKSVIKYPKEKWPEMRLLPEENGRLFCLLPGNKISLYSPQQYRQIDFQKLRKTESPHFFFDMKQPSNTIQTKEDLIEALALKQP